MTDHSWTFPEGLLKKIPPNHYMHIMDNVLNVVRLEVGPQTLLCKDQEQAVVGPIKMIIIPPRHYAVINNPVVRKKQKDDGTEVVVFDKYGQVQLRHGDREVRFHQPPFPLYPGESLEGNVAALPVLGPNTALRLQAVRDFVDENVQDEEEKEETEGKSTSTMMMMMKKKNKKKKRVAGEEWLWFGPSTYIPAPQVRIVQTVNAIVLKPGQDTLLFISVYSVETSCFKRLH
eukprot:TRINITY_DN230_c2_g1_i2.p1 TRINITY_DN230_c2_g1~~TRINITY_DN230_c2_g1_i2.p1  ORF type:complete len:231 (-),score=46.80 TRINITY_DN230_c2_g1_i2:938-1630(-)